MVTLSPSFSNGVISTENRIGCIVYFRTYYEGYSFFPAPIFFYVLVFLSQFLSFYFLFVWQVDYFVDCHYSMPDDRLWLIGGTTAGTLGYFPVRNDPAGAIGLAEAILEGGHTEVVRAVYPAAGIHESLGQNRGIFGWTGGEDGRLCCWRSDEISEMNKSWISTSLVWKQQKKTKNRHLPY